MGDEEVRELLSKIAGGTAIALSYTKRSERMVLSDGARKVDLDNPGNNIALASDGAREMSESWCIVDLLVRERHDDGTVGDIWYMMTKGDAEEALRAQELANSQRHRPEL